MSDYNLDIINKDLNSLKESEGRYLGAFWYLAISLLVHALLEIADAIRDLKRDAR